MSDRWFNQEEFERRFYESLEREPDNRRPRPRFDFQQRENSLSAITLARTIAFLLYSLLVPLITLALFVFLPLQSFSREVQFALAVVLYVGLEWLLLIGVVRGILPSPQAENVRPFNEHQMAIGVALLSLTPWLLRFDQQRFEIFQIVINGSLCLGVLVFFVTKSMISRRFRWGVLLALLLPLFQLFALFR